MITLKEIREFSATFPGMEEGTSYGTPAFRVGKKLLLRMHDTEDAIVVMLGSVEEQQELIAKSPRTFYITDHYEDYAAVLVRPTISKNKFRDLMETSWRRIARKRDIAEFEQF